MRGRHRANRKTDYVQKNQTRGRSKVDLLRYRFTHLPVGITSVGKDFHARKQ